MDGWKNGLIMEGWVDVLMGEWMAQVINSQKTARNSIRIYTVNGKKRIKNDLSVCKEDGNRYIPSWDHSGERFAVKSP